MWPPQPQSPWGLHVPGSRDSSLSLCPSVGGTASGLVGTGDTGPAHRVLGSTSGCHVPPVPARSYVLTPAPDTSRPLLMLFPVGPGSPPASAELPGSPDATHTWKWLPPHPAPPSPPRPCSQASRGELHRSPVTLWSRDPLADCPGLSHHCCSRVAVSPPPTPTSCESFCPCF